jgi:hypothetical protein
MEEGLGSNGDKRSTGQQLSTVPAPRHDGLRKLVQIFNSHKVYYGISLSLYRHGRRLLRAQTNKIVQIFDPTHWRFIIFYGRAESGLGSVCNFSIAMNRDASKSL